MVNYSFFLFFFKIKQLLSTINKGKWHGCENSHSDLLQVSCTDIHLWLNFVRVNLEKYVYEQKARDDLQQSSWCTGCNKQTKARESLTSRSHTIISCSWQGDLTLTSLPLPTWTNEGSVGDRSLHSVVFQTAKMYDKGYPWNRTSHTQGHSCLLNVSRSIIISSVCRSYQTSHMGLNVLFWMPKMDLGLLTDS